MGVVSRATDTRLGRPVAIKVNAADAGSGRDRRERFLREARAASALNHPNIVTSHEVDRANGIDFLVMELAVGRPLREMIPRAGLPLEHAIALAEQNCDALASAHAAGIVHRDVKPGNIVISDRGQAKMLDFGLAKIVEPGEPAADTITAPFATEAGVVSEPSRICRRNRHWGGQSPIAPDVFSFGVALYEMLAGRRPFASVTIDGLLTKTPPPIGSVRTDMLPALEALVGACLDKAPAHRPSAFEVAERLRAIRGRLTAAPFDARAWLQQRAVIAALAAVAVAALSLGWWWWTATARVRWARTVAIPQIRLLSERDDVYGATCWRPTRGARSPTMRS